MKKLLSILLCITIVFSCVSVLASSTDDEIELTKQMITEKKNNTPDDEKDNQIFVKAMDDSKTEKIIKEALKDFEYEIVKQYNLSKAYLVKFESVQKADEAIDILNARRDIKYAQPNYYISLPTPVVDGGGVLIEESTQTEEPKGDGTPPRYYTFEELTGLSREDVDHIVIRSGIDGVGYSTAYDEIITDIYNFINTKSFLTYPLEDVRDGWKYEIMFFDKNNNTSTYTISSGMIVPGKGGFMFKTGNEGALEIAVEKAYKQMALDCTNWASDYVIEANDLGITENVTDLEYKKPITREKFCEMIYNMLDKSMTVEWQKVSPNPFKDTVNEKVFSLHLEGIIEGKGEYTFAPDDFLTREEAATILIRTAQFMGIGMPENAYDSKVYDDENNISDWAFASVHYCRKLGVMIGTSETEFSPKDEYTAEQAIATILRLYEKSESKIENPVLKLVDKDENIILTEKDIAWCEGSTYNPQGPGGGALGQTIKFYIVDEAIADFTEATKRISEYPSGENFISVLIDDIVIHNAPLYKELDSGCFVISGGGFVLPREYITQKVVFSLKEEQRNVQIGTFFSGSDNTFKIGFLIENDNEHPLSFKSNTSDFIDIEVYDSNGEMIGLEQNSLSVLSEEIIENSGMIFEEYPKDKLPKGAYRAVIKWDCQAAVDKGNGEFERIHLIDREIQFEIK